MLSSTKDRAYRLRYNRNQIRVDNCFEASVQLGFLGGLIVSRGWQGRKINMNCMGNGYEMNGWMKRNTKPQRKKKISQVESQGIFWAKSSQVHRMEGSKKLGAWWYGYIVPLFPREWCGLLTSPRVCITFLGLGKASKVLERWFRTWKWWFGRSGRRCYSQVPCWLIFMVHQ